MTTEANNDDVFNMYLSRYINADQMNDKSVWVFANHMGIVYIKRLKDLRKINNVANKRRSTPISNYGTFYENIRTNLSEQKFVHISVGKNCRVRLFYCHRLVNVVKSGTQILLIGNVQFAKGLFFESQNELIDADHGCHILLQYRPFKIRINANAHLIFII